MKTADVTGRTTELILLILFLTLQSFCPAWADEKNGAYVKTVTAMREFIRNHMNQNRVEGLSIALVDGDNVVWLEGFGTADREKHIPVTADTVFEIGSISKTFATLAILRLSEEGRIDIDKPIEKYIPEFSIQQRFPHSGPITIRSILTHHSGIPGDLFNGSFTVKSPFDYSKWLLESLKGEYTAFPVNSVFSYSNSAFTLLNLIIDRAGGGFKKYTDSIFDMIGMPNTSYQPDERIRKEILSYSYIPAEDEKAPGNTAPRTFVNMGTAGSVLSSARDMSSYVIMLLKSGKGRNGQVISQESFRRMMTPQNGDIYLDFDQEIGFSWFLENPAGGRYGKICKHTGATFSYIAHVEAMLDEGLGVAVMSNNQSADVIEIARETLLTALEEKKGERAVLKGQNPDSVSNQIPQDLMNSIAGTYITRKGLAFAFDRIETQGRTLLIKAESGIFNEPTILIPTRDGWFAPEKDNRRRLRFMYVDGRQVMILQVSGNRYLYGEKYQPLIIPGEWKNNYGKYELINLNPDDASLSCPALSMSADRIELAEKNGIPIIAGTIRDTVPIRPISGNLAFTAGLGRNSGESVRVFTGNDDSQRYVEFWGLRYRRVK